MQKMKILTVENQSDGIVLNYRYLNHPATSTLIDRISQKPFVCQGASFKLLTKLNSFVEHLGLEGQKMERAYQAFMEANSIKDAEGNPIAEKGKVKLQDGAMEKYEKEFLTTTFVIPRGVKLTESELTYLDATPLEFPALFPLL